MLSAQITGIGWVTAGGCGQGRQQQDFTLTAGELPTLSRADIFEKPDRRFGRMDPFSKLGLAGITFALRDAGLERWGKKRQIGMIAATAYGCLGTDSDYFDTVIPQGGALASPQLFAYTLSNTFLGEAAIRFGLTGDAQVVSKPIPSGLTPLGLALESLAWSDAEGMVAGVCDLSTPVGVPEVPGALPGAVFLVLERNMREAVSSYGELSRDGDQRYWFCDSPVRDVAELVERCLSRVKS
jgi:3-oxoacyl-[acyl-carrier-protein] synthase II